MATTKEDILLKYREEHDFERFIKFIDNFEAWGVDPNQCCLWTGYKLKFGHGQFALSRKGGNKTANGGSIIVLAHRLSYYIYWGEKVPENLVCHIPKIEEGEEGRIVYDNKGNELICLKGCHNPGCVNPLHLYDGTYKQNMKDKEQDGTSKHTEEHIRKVAEATRKTYKITYNNGTTVIVHNLKKFAKDNGMNYGSLTNCASKGDPYKKFGILKVEVIINLN
jgi:hypothetical protein